MPVKVAYFLFALVNVTLLVMLISLPSNPISLIAIGINSFILGQNIANLILP
jgi:hypothetical protein